MSSVSVPAKINLALLVGEPRADGFHEVATVLQRIEICDRLELVEASELTVEGFTEDNLVRGALVRLGQEADVEPRWRVRLSKRIPVAAGLGGGSADAGAALALANATLREPLAHERLLAVAADVGSDVPFFLEPGPKLAEGRGEKLTPLTLPQDFAVVVALPREARKSSTGDVYRRLGETGARARFEERRLALLDAIARCRRPEDLAALPPNDLADAVEVSPLREALRAGGAFRADMTGAGPALYGLFPDRRAAHAAARLIAGNARVWVTAPVW